MKLTFPPPLHCSTGLKCWRINGLDPGNANHMKCRHLYLRTPWLDTGACGPTLPHRHFPTEKTCSVSVCEHIYERFCVIPLKYTLLPNQKNGSHWGPKNSWSLNGNHYDIMSGHVVFAGELRILGGKPCHLPSCSCSLNSVYSGIPTTNNVMVLTAETKTGRNRGWFLVGT